ncbi:hypothetical protein ABTI56_18825, partial [Acinetobacter baumannii]
MLWLTLQLLKATAIPCQVMATSTETQEEGIRSQPLPRLTLGRSESWPKRQQLLSRNNVSEIQKTGDD